MTPKTVAMEQCGFFIECDASLCPLDPDLNERVWYADEPVCRSRKFGKHRWIRKQRSIQRRQTKSWLKRPIIYDQLFSASRKRQLPDGQLAELRARMKKVRRVNAENISNKEMKSNIATF